MHVHWVKLSIPLGWVEDKYSLHGWTMGNTSCAIVALRCTAFSSVGCTYIVQKCIGSSSPISWVYNV